MRVRRGAVLGAVALSVVGMVAAYRLGRARADGVPMVNPLYYGGMLDDGGRPVEGTRNVTVRLWDAATAGATVCTTNAGATAFSGGRFRVALDGACVGAVRANPELWAELQVEGTTFPRSKLGAVPYALEAGRATGAAGALEARLAAVEGRSTGGRQVVVAEWNPTLLSGATYRVPLSCPVPAPTVPGWIRVPGPGMLVAITPSVSGLFVLNKPNIFGFYYGDSYQPSGIRISVTPSVLPQFVGTLGPVYRLESGVAYSFFVEVPVRVPCDENMSALTSGPIFVEQLN